MGNNEEVKHFQRLSLYEFTSAFLTEISLLHKENHSPFELTLLVDKPLNWTSFDVVNKLRYAAKTATGQKRIKVGHAGTLDPLATGLVIICIGRHTKQINDYMSLTKQYTGTFKLGETTPSYDLETEPDHHYPLPKNDAKFLSGARLPFLGEISQVPPAFSAKKINGQKAYDLARKGKDVSLKPSVVSISRFDIAAENFPFIDFVLDCSKGTYVRSLVHDYGKSLHSGAHLTKLNRTKIGDFSIDNALTIDKAIEAIKEAYKDHQQTISKSDSKV